MIEKTEKEGILLNWKNSQKSICIRLFTLNIILLFPWLKSKSMIKDLQFPSVEIKRKSKESRK